MVRYFTIILMLIFATPVFGAVYSGNSEGFTEVSAIQQYQSDEWKDISVKEWSGSVWYSLISYTSDIWHFWVCMGQSNMQGAGDSSLSPDLPATTAIEIKEDLTITDGLADPMGQGTSLSESFIASVSGSLLPKFCEKYYALSGHPVVILHLAKGATGQCSAADLWSRGYWTMNLYNAAKPIIDSALAKLTTEGYNYEWQGVLWYQGENDAIAGLSASAYTSCANQMQNQFWTDFSAYSSLSFNMVQIVPLSEEGDVIADAQAALCASRANTYLLDNITTTNLDLVQSELNTLGENIATEICNR